VSQRCLRPELLRSHTGLSVLRRPANKPVAPKCHSPLPDGRPVLRHSACQLAAPKCHAPWPSGLPVLRRPASGYAPWRATAQAHRSRGCRRHCLALWPRPATVVPSLSSAQQTFRRANGLEHPVQHSAECLGCSWRPNRPLPNRLFKGTSTRYAVCRPLTPALGFSCKKDDLRLRKSGTSLKLVSRCSSFYPAEVFCDSIQWR
jgi:hypothetical protein